MAKHQRHDITREFIRAIQPTGSYQDFADKQRGFAVKVTPKGGISYTYRWRKPDGMQGRKVIGWWPEMQPGDARKLALKESTLIDHKGDTLTRQAERKTRRAQVVKAIAAVPTVQAFLDGDYAVYVRTHNKKPERQIYMIRQSFPDFLETPLDAVTAWSVEKWRGAQLKAGLSPSTCNRKLNSLRGLFSRAVEWDVLTESPLKEVKKQREPSGKVRYLSPEERARLDVEIETGCPPHLKPAVVLAMNTGLRLTELTTLEWSNVDLDHAFLTVIDAHSKSGTGRHIPLNDGTLAMLKAWKRQADKRYVFANADGVPMRIITGWPELRARGEIVGFRWHDFRHDFASRLVMVGVALNTVRDLLGHADMKMTLRYAHLSPDCKAAAVALLNAAPVPRVYAMAA
ncbi:tyrosine-type recombinase/integrase [Caballeronia sp.]|uniref:tyrosine-type recombinase/integrase n=1 Tax=Caballeronia sp. TaxID=1931223 RepID=UPI003C55A4C9